MYSTEEAKTIQDKLTNIITELEEVANLCNYSYEYSGIELAKAILAQVKKYTFEDKNYILKIKDDNLMYQNFIPQGVLGGKKCIENGSHQKVKLENLQNKCN